MIPDVIGMGVTAEMKAELEAGGVAYEWHEYNAAHAFLRDECSGGRYDAELALATYASAVAFFRRRLGAPAPAASATTGAL